MIVCWSVKGGSGTTVVAAALAILLSHRRPTLLVDLGDDQPVALGVPLPTGPGVGDWLGSTTTDDDALSRLALPVADDLGLIARGSAPPAVARWHELAVALARRHAVIDATTGMPPAALIDNAVESLLVIRPCYLALHRVCTADVQPTGIVLITEPGRQLDADAVERAVSAPVVAKVPLDPAIARAVDGGLLAGRLPRTLAGPLQRVVRSLAG